MHIKLEINAESVEEFDAAVARFAPKPSIGGGEWGDKVVITDVAERAAFHPRGSTAAEAETPLEPAAPKKSRIKPATAAAPSTASTSDLEPAGAIGGAQIEGDDEHPMLTPKTLAEVKALGNKKVSELGAGPIQQALSENFQVKAFGGLDPADYDRAYAILEALK